MPDSQVNWVLNLVDNISSPIKAIVSGIPTIGTSFKTVGNAVSSELTELNKKLSVLKLKLDNTLLIGERAKINDEIAKTKKEIDNLNSSLDKTNQETQKSETLFKKLGDSALNFNQIKMAAESVNQAFVDLTKSPVEFQTSMLDLKAITGATGETFNKIESNARNLAKTFGGTASQSAESYKLILSKLSPELAKTPAVLDGMAKNAMLLSKTMGGDVAGATELLSAGMNQFSVDMSNPQAALAEMTRQMNIMSASAKEGSAEMPQIKLAVENVGAVAKQTGASFESMNASIQILDKYGKSGAEGGIALRNIYSKLIKDPTKDVRNGLEKAGVNMSVLHDKSVKFTDKMRELKKAAGDEALMLKMFGDENYLAAVALMNNADAQDALEKKIVGTNTTQEQADIIMGSIAEKTKRLRAHIDDLKISFGQYTGSMIPAATIMGENLVVLGQMAPALSLLKSGFLAMIPATVKATVAQWNLNVAMDANPVGAIVAAIAVLIAEITLVIVYFDEITEWFNGLPGIVKILVGVFAALTQPILVIVYLLKKLYDSLDFKKIGNFFKSVSKVIKSAFNSIVKFVKGIFIKIGELVKEYNPFTMLINSLDKVFPGLKEKIFKVWNVIKEKLIDPIKNAISSVFDWLFTSPDEAKDKKKSGKEMPVSDKTYSPFDFRTFTGFTGFRGQPMGMLAQTGSVMGGKTKTEGTTSPMLLPTPSDITGDKGGNRILNIKNLIEKFELHTTNLSESSAKIQEEIKKAILTAVNDSFHYA